MVYFYPGVSWEDLDNDKLTYTSCSFKKYGMHMMTTADQNHKHVIHCMASVSTGCITWIYPKMDRDEKKCFFNWL